MCLFCKNKNHNIKILSTMNTSGNVWKIFFFSKFYWPNFTSILNNDKIIIDSIIMQKNSKKYNNDFFKVFRLDKFDGNDWKKFDFWLLQVAMWIYDINMSTNKKCCIVFAVSFLYGCTFKWIQFYFWQFLKKKKIPQKCSKILTFFEIKYK